MIIESARLALEQLFSPGFRAVLWKSLGLTIVLLVGLWFTMDWLFSAFLLPMIGAESWIGIAASWLLGFGLVIGLGFLIAPVTSIFGGFFVDDIARKVEQKYYPEDVPGRDFPVAQSAVITLKFAILVIATNLLALMLLLVPGINLIVFFVANGYLLGREYFQFAALRFLSVRDANALRRQNSGRVFSAGMLIAGFLAVPLLNLLTPLFAAALMVHMFKKCRNSRPGTFETGSIC